MIFVPLLLAWLILPFASAKRIFYGNGGVAFYTCATAVQKAAAFCEGEYAEIPYLCLCANSNAMATVTGCFADIDEDASEANSYYTYFCNANFHTNFTSETIEQAYMLYKATAQNLTTLTAVNVSTTPLIIPQLLYPELELLKKSFKVTLGNVDYTWYFGIGCLAYWGLMLVVSGIVNWCAVLFPGLRNFFNGALSKLIRRLVVLPALAGMNKNVPLRAFGIFDFIMPSRLESIVSFCFFWLVFVLNVFGIKYVTEDPQYTSKSTAIASLVSNRTTLLAMILTPLAFLMEGRNNILLWVTRWKRSTMIYYSRFIGKLVVLMVFVHMLCITSLYNLLGIYSLEIKGPDMSWGIVALVCGFLMWALTTFFFKKNYYEFQATVKIPLVIFWLIGMWFNTASFQINQIIYPSFAVWGFDTLVRVIRIISFGFPSAQVSLLPDNTLKIEMPKPKTWTSAPGRYAYVHFLDGLYFFQNHPFMYYESVSNNTLIMKCKVHDGITKTLSRKLEASPKGQLAIRIAVDGPYGFSSPVHHNSVVFAAGGSAIGGVYSEAVSFAKKSVDSSRSIKLVWAVPNFDSVAGFEKELQELSTTSVEATVYLTNAAQIERTSIKNEESKSLEESIPEKSVDYASNLQSRLQHVTFVYDRPQLQNVVEQEVAEANGSIAFVVSGPARMSDEMRKHVVQQIGQNEKRVDFYDQMQIWA